MNETKKTLQETIGKQDINLQAYPLLSQTLTNMQSK